VPPGRRTEANREREGAPWTKDRGHQGSVRVSPGRRTEGSVRRETAAGRRTDPTREPSCGHFPSDSARRCSSGGRGCSDRGLCPASGGRRCPPGGHGCRTRAGYCEANCVCGRCGDDDTRSRPTCTSRGRRDPAANAGRSLHPERVTDRDPRLRPSHRPRRRDCGQLTQAARAHPAPPSSILTFPVAPHRRYASIAIRRYRSASRPCPRARACRSASSQAMASRFGAWWSRATVMARS